MAGQDQMSLSFRAMGSANSPLNDDTWYVVRNTRGVTGFVGPGSKPVPLTEEEMMPLGIQKPDIEVDFAEGDMVVVT